MKSLVFVLALALPLVSQEDERLGELIGRLVDDDIGVREKAAADLADVGSPAIPMLERLRKSPDLELSSRAASILKAIAENQIVGRHWRRGPRITLDFTDAPASAVLAELARQAGDAFKFDAAELQDRITIQVREATFWDALDELCRVAPALTWDADPNGGGLAFSKKRRPPYPAKRQAEFNVWLDGITFSRDYDFTGNPRSTFTLQVASAWEAGVGPVAVEQKVTEILDEDGTNLIVPDRFNYQARMDTPKGRLKRDGVYAPLPQGGKSPRKFSKVRGSSTFYFPRAYEELTVDLRSVPPPMTVDRLTIAVRNFRAMKDAWACEVVVTASTTGGDGLIDRLPFSDLVLIDDQGSAHRGKASSRNQSYSGTSYTIHENLQVPLPEGRTAVTLKLRVLKDVLEKRVNFEFSDIQVE
jgi:hypothetical protein